MKHTPGKWELAELVNPTLILHKKPDVQGCYRKIADCDLHPEADIQENIANARLIAAAPEMLELLQFINERYEARLKAEQPDYFNYIETLLTKLEG